MRRALDVVVMVASWGVCLWNLGAIFRAGRHGVVTLAFQA
jgi:hypothetical protein